MVDNSGTIIVCPACGAKNRIHNKPNEAKYVCGACKAALAKPPGEPTVHVAQNENGLTNETPTNAQIDFEDEQLPVEPLTPHQYPIRIKLFAFALALSVIYSFYLLPEYFDAAKVLTKGARALQNKQYGAAIASFKRVLEIVPSSETAKLAMAEAMFANADPADDRAGLALLESISLDKDEWEQIAPVMPAEYKKYFKSQ